MILKDLIVKLFIEEDNRKAEDPKPRAMDAKANLLERGDTSNKRKRGQKDKVKRPTKAPKFSGVCYNCGKSGHKASDCKKPKNKGKENKAPMLSKQMMIGRTTCVR